MSKYVNFSNQARRHLVHNFVQIQLLLDQNQMHNNTVAISVFL